MHFRANGRMIDMATVVSTAEERLRFSQVPWAKYVAYCDSLEERHIRVTYDRGEMEVMTLSSKHENRKKLLARFVEALTEEMSIDIASYGSMTCRREDLERALEGDECYWIANEPTVRGRTDLDLENDPPPDLFLEIEISRSLLDRMGILAAMRVPEVWRWDGVHFRAFVLRDGAYHASDHSLAFPFLPLQEFAQFLQRTDLSETKLVKAFRAWVREQMARAWK